MSLRAIDGFGLLVACAAGAALSPGTISGDAGRVLITFLGLVSASVLPTISLLIGAMTASGRSIQAINKLEAELQAAMDALFLLFGCVAVAVAALIALSIEPAQVLRRVPYLTSEILPRIGQMIVVGSTALIVFRAGQIPGILRKSLAIRHEIAVDEARRKLSEKAPDAEAIRASFKTHENFGRVVSLQDLHKSEGS